MKPDRNDLLHIESCALIVIIVGAFLPLWSACLAALVAGIVKELWDREHGGVPSWCDIFLDIVGIIIGGLIAIARCSPP